ncbi:ATP-dependent DNA helicase RecQ [Marivirga tractuosa]|uniref:DNA helicase RecQ n=1 Tax=Marivirga tractuosa (strain ATCC 23168 / DSM 4126 / NBRC 15989 / NCIMB 1408 / VKM B-1430 / H-43) TaxID=643867 RepID=E4TL45_MARTH|nr:DNA helicase RecQ [Marivirga tractuosa]ADR23322.1 ATP-dependent DNA helicase RecQ [Marivirga tractuosa DSM 4126]BDD16004.1 ATP-dependent DNA helicase RecQ [Marivirga tractuosa]
MIEEQEATLKEKLKEVFGYNQFRGNQELIMQNLINGKNTFVIMPTGAGKSLCYQLPAISREGTALVVSPLIALMKNQVDTLVALGVNAAFLNSTLTKTETKRVKKEVMSGNLKLLYVAPESLTKEENVEFLKQANISFAAIDEAHCISEWGHDFRPEYRRIKSILQQISNIPIIALTATATPKVQLDIQKNLNMEEANVFKSSFNRENLYYEVRPKNQAKKQLIRFLNERKGKCGVIYCLSRKKVEEIAEFLNVNGFNAAPYHAGLEGATRMKNQDDFLNEDVDIIVATIAFGMGIDKPDVRFVIHYDTPKSVEGYYQETGRAGRDGLVGDCLMFYSYNDILKLEKFNKDKPVTEKENAKLLLEEMSSYAESSVCRRKQLLHYFGEEFADYCGKCDNCRHPKEKFDAKDEMITVLKTVKLTNQRFGINHLVNVIRGSKDQYVTSYDHNKLDVHGVGADQDVEFWKSVIRQTMLYGYLEKDIENIGVLKINKAGEDFLKNPTDIQFTVNHVYTDDGDEDQIEKDAVSAKAFDETLYTQLKALRKKVAKSKNLPPYVIFQDPSLEEMATTYPTTNEEMAAVNGVGLGKVRKFGKPFMELIKEYVDENDIITAADVMVKSSVNKSKMKIFIIQQVDKKIDLEEIAEMKDISFEELIDEIEHICYSGTTLNLNYYLNQIIDDDKQEEIMEYFLSAESDSIDDAMDEFDEEFSEEDLRLMRIKFLSTYAN